MYNWRKMTEKQKEYVLKKRKQKNFPLHSLPHFLSKTGYYHISAANYEHKSIIGKNHQRISEFEDALFKIAERKNFKFDAYAVLPNHYHILLSTTNIKNLLKDFFLLHQKTGFYWNKEDNLKGRRVWCNLLDSPIKSDRHYWATINYINNNPVKHGYVNKWQDWPFSSAVLYLDNIGKENAECIWNKYDISGMCKWDTHLKL